MVKLHATWEIKQLMKTKYKSGRGLISGIMESFPIYTLKVYLALFAVRIVISL